MLSFALNKCYTRGADEGIDLLIRAAFIVNRVKIRSYIVLLPTECTQ